MLGLVYRAAMGGQFMDGLALSMAVKLFLVAFDAAIGLVMFIAVDRAIGRERAFAALAGYAINPAT
jgi:hypothetical protein